MHASFVVQRASSGHPAHAAAWVGTAPEWALWEVELADVAEIMASSSDAVIIASVDDSSVCEIVGFGTGLEHWRWIFGESSGDDDALEDSLPERARDTAQRIETWAATAGLSTDPTQLIAILSSGYLFAETGLFDLLRHFGIAGEDLAEGDQAPESPPYEAPVIAESVPPADAVEPSARAGMYAARLDHDRDPEAWARFVDFEALHDYGKPPAVLRRREGAKLVMACDPPVQTSGWGAAAPTVEGLTGEWLPVPESARGSIAESAAWAYQQFGPARIAPEPHRRPLRGEVDDEPPDKWREGHDDSWRYEIARHRHVRAVFTLIEDIAVARGEVAAWLEDAHVSVIEGIIAGFEASGGTVAHDASDFPHPARWVLAVSSGCDPDGSRLARSLAKSGTD